MIYMHILCLLPSEHFAMDSQSFVVTGVINLALNFSVCSSEIVQGNLKKYLRLSQWLNILLNGK
jgi:hypothetical protein